MAINSVNQGNGSGWGLALHTVSRELGLAIDNQEGGLRCQTWDLGRDLSSQLHTHLMEFVRPQTWQDLQFLAVAIGPGGFTGTRIGTVAARTLAQQLNLPLFGISTLAAVAWAGCAPDRPEKEDLAVQMQAQREQLFVAIYRADNHTLQMQFPDQVMPLEDWQQTLSTWPRPYQLICAPEQIAATVSSVLALARHRWQHGDRPQWSEVLPFYGQHPVTPNPAHAEPTATPTPYP